MERKGKERKGKERKGKEREGKADIQKGTESAFLTTHFLGMKVKTTRNRVETEEKP